MVTLRRLAQLGALVAVVAAVRYIAGVWAAAVVVAAAAVVGLIAGLRWLDAWGSDRALLPQPSSMVAERGSDHLAFARALAAVAAAYVAECEREAAGDG